MMDWNAIATGVLLAIPVMSSAFILWMSYRAPHRNDWDEGYRPPRPSLDVLRRRTLAEQRATLDRTEARAAEVLAHFGVSPDHSRYHSAMEYAMDWLHGDGSSWEMDALREGVEREVGKPVEAE